jgi:hypothetical protein
VRESDKARKICGEQKGTNNAAKKKFYCGEGNIGKMKAFREGSFCQLTREF